MSRLFHTSRPPDCVSPRGRSGLSREYTHGKIVPMDRPEGEHSLFVGFLAASGGLGGIALFILLWEIFA